jgi:hypothetical protein
MIGEMKVVSLRWRKGLTRVDMEPSQQTLPDAKLRDSYLLRRGRLGPGAKRAATSVWSCPLWNLLVARGRGDFRFREERIIELGIHFHLCNDDLLCRNVSLPYSSWGLRSRQDLCLYQKRNLQAIHRTVVAVVDFDWMINAVEPPGLPFPCACRHQSVR